MKLTVTGQLLLPTPDGSVRLSPGTVTVEGERISGVSPTLHPSPDLGGEGHFICPGLIDAHLHLPQFDSIGVDGLELLDWLRMVIFPAEARWADAEYARGMAERVAAELLSFGTVGVAAYATSHHAGAQAAIEALGAAGLAGCVGQVLMDRNGPPELLVPARRAIAEAAGLTGSGRVQPSVTPRFAVACSEEMLRGAGELAAKTGWMVQTHVSETRRECELVSELFPGQTYLGVYRKTGLLTGRTVLAHGVWFDETDLARVKGAGAVVAHCPTANRFLMAGEMDLRRSLDAGVKVALGSDVAGGPDRSMVRVARGMIETCKQIGRVPPTAAQAGAQITRWNAEVLGMEGMGRLGAGAWADVLVVKPMAGWMGSPDPLSTLLYAWDDRWLERVVVAGKVVGA